MYHFPTILPQFSNREDFLLTLSLSDDESASPGQSPTTINLDYTTRAAAGPFTSAAWTVKDGAITTASVTSITIPDYPIGNQLTALALVVGVGLAILPGDLIVISDTLTGLNTMTGYAQSYVPATGALVVQIGFTFQFEIRRGPPAGQGGYVPYYDWGGVSEQAAILSASLGSGITHIDVGVIQILIPEVTFKTLSSMATRQDYGPGTFMACLTCTNSVETRQLFIASLPLFHGGVSI